MVRLALHGCMHLMVESGEVRTATAACQPVHICSEAASGALPYECALADVLRLLRVLHRKLRPAWGDSSLLPRQRCPPQRWHNQGDAAINFPNPFPPAPQDCPIPRRGLFLWQPPLRAGQCARCCVVAQAALQPPRPVLLCFFTACPPPHPLSSPIICCTLLSLPSPLLLRYCRQCAAMTCRL